MTGFYFAYIRCSLYNFNKRLIKHIYLVIFSHSQFYLDKHLSVEGSDYALGSGGFFFINSQTSSVVSSGISPLPLNDIS